MYLAEIEIKSFRSFNNAVISFEKNLTALVGENNSGKSNIIDALRLMTLPLNGRRDRYCEEADVRESKEKLKGFSLKTTYQELSPIQKGLLISAVPDPFYDKAIFGLDFTAPTKDKLRGEVNFWAGKHGLEPEAGSADLIRHVYLPPLRDAQRMLASGNATRILSLLRHFLKNEGDEKNLVEALRRKAEHGTLTIVNETVNNLLEQLTVGVRCQTSSLNFSDDETLGDIARDLRFKLADDGINPEDLLKSGLGFANLLFMSTILVELEKAQEADLTLFLVEEPEAHLHPQLQATVLNFLLEQAKSSHSKERLPGKPDGRIQVIVTTHSPNMAAGVSPKHLTVVRSINNLGERRESIAIPIDKLGLLGSELRKVERYIDVTKSSLLFGRKCLLVEGIVEALLLPIIAKKYVYKDSDKESKEKLKKFLGTALIPIHGTDFLPYAKVLLSPFFNYSICDLVVVITDLDSSIRWNRKKELTDLAQGINAQNKLNIFLTNTDTLESEIFLKNKDLLKLVYLDLHPRSEKTWEEKILNAPSEEQPKNFVKLLKSSNTKKGDFAHLLVAHIEDNDLSCFSPPEYLINAIKAIVE